MNIIATWTNLSFESTRCQNYLCNIPPKEWFLWIIWLGAKYFELSSFSILSKYLLLGSVWRDGTCKPSTFWHPPRLLGQVPVRLYSCTIANSLTNTCSSVLLYYITSLTHGLVPVVPPGPPTQCHRLEQSVRLRLGLLLERGKAWTTAALSHSCWLGAWQVGWPPK